MFAVMVLRLILRRAPKGLMLVLWGIVALRLVLPASVQSIFSLIPSAETISPDIMEMQEPRIHSGITAFNSAVNPAIMHLPRVRRRVRILCRSLFLLLRSAGSRVLLSCCCMR